MGIYKENEYFSIELSKLISGKTLTFDLYVYLPLNQRIVLILKNTESPDGLTLEHYKSKGVQLFYVRNNEKEAFEKYFIQEQKLDLTVELKDTSEKKIDDPELDVVKEVPSSMQDPIPEEVLANAKAEAEAAIVVDAPPLPVPEIQPEVHEEKEFIPDLPLDDLVANFLSEDEEEQKSAIEKGRDMVNQILKDAPESVRQIMQDNTAEHATTVAVYSTLFLMGLGTKDQYVLQDIIIASLLHDIGFSQLHPSCLKDPVTKKTAADLAEYEKHVSAGFELLKELDYTPNTRTAQLLSEHHEKFDGTGFPAKLDSFNINEMAQILHFCDFLEDIMSGRHDGTSRTMVDAFGVIAQIEKKTTFPEHFNPDVYRKIRNWLTKGAGKDYMEAATKTVEEAKSKMMDSA